jgi:GYF domain 2
MKYYIQRQLNEYGPYTLGDLQRYVAQGNILLTDLARSEGMTEWVPVSQVIGNIPIPVSPQPMQNPAYGGGPMYGAAGGTVYGSAGTVYSGAAAIPAVEAGPIPPDFHWALVLLIGFVTCGLFWWAWWIVEAAFLRKIKPDSKALLLVVLSCVGCYLGSILNSFLRAVSPGDPSLYGTPFSLIGLVLFFFAEFQMKNDLEEYYNSMEPINLQLSGVMTFFFAVWYFQHHLSRIAQWKKTGILQPQG